MENMLPLFVAVPLGAAFLLPLIEKALRKDWLADTLSMAAALALICMAIAILPGGKVTYWMGGWDGSGAAKPIGICLVADGLTRLLLITVNMVALAAVIFSLQYMRRYTSKGLYFSLFFLMLAGMNGVVLTGDMFNLYVFLEVAAIASYALVAYGCESEELEASFKYLILGSLGSTFVLFGVGMLYNQTGTLNMAQIAQHITANGLNRVTLLAASFFFMGFGLKAAMVPFHAWLPDAHPSAPAPISAMLSGVLLTALGVYALSRIYFNVLGIAAPGFAQVLMTLGALSMIMGVLLAVGQWDFKRLLAYHSISQMGYVVLAVGVGGYVLSKGGDRSVAALAIFGGLFHLFNHAAFKSLLFLCSGAAEYATGTRQLKELGGLVHKMPVTSACCRIAALSISGVPPFSGFWSKLIIIMAVYKAGFPFLAVMTVVVSFLTLLSFVKVQRYVLHGPVPAALERVREVPVGMCVAMILLAVVCVGAGLLCPLIQGELFEPARDVLVRGIGAVQVALLGG